MSSVEEMVEDYYKTQLNGYGIRYFTKTESINDEIDNALKKAPSKSGGTGNNYPDIKLMIQSEAMRIIPVMIEAKGKKGDLIKLDKENEIDLNSAKAIQKYAVNGAIHYAKSIIEFSNSYKECIAIGVNGFKNEDGSLSTELETYYISKDNFLIPQKIDDYTDLSFLKNKNINKLLEKIDSLNLTEEEVEKKAKETENELDKKLRAINQVMQDTLQINVNFRVNLITGMIMAGLGVENKIAPLEIEELKGNIGKKDHDGYILLNKIESFLGEKSLPQEKREMIISTLSNVFIYDQLWKPVNGESKLKSIYTMIYNDILPIFHSSHHLDFTGKLFNVLNEWVNVPDGDKNDVVFTPRYVTDLMAKLAKVDMNSYVWDYATGSAGFLVSSMKIMLNDAANKIKSLEELTKKQNSIKYEQLLGIEKLSDIYMLAVLNMILMGDGSSNIIHKDSLKEFDGKYEQGDNKDKDFPANVFLLNPPYSADGKGFIFVEKAFSKMKSGRGVILIQENAGSGNGLPYTKNLLKNNTLLASIHMSDIFCGKAGVQTAIYVFEIGKAHNVKQMVKFIDFSNDGYTRQNRKKSSQAVNLKDTDHAKERYEELVNLVLYGKKYLKYFTEEDYIEDTISLDGNDWTYSMHKKINTEATEEDFKNTIKEYLSWKVSEVLKGV